MQVFRLALWQMPKIYRLWLVCDNTPEWDTTRGGEGGGLGERMERREEERDRMKGGEGRGGFERMG